MGLGEPLQKNDTGGDNGETTDCDREVRVNNEENKDVRCAHGDVDVLSEEIDNEEAIDRSNGTTQEKARCRLDGRAESALDSNDEPNAKQ